jgi:hypothetical protein
MAYTNIDLQEALASDSIGFFIGVPRTRVEMTGLINGTNKDFTIPITKGPIYPKNGLSITPQVADVVVETKKGETYTVVTVASISEVTDVGTNKAYYGKVSLEAAPTAEGADKVYISYAEEFEPFIAQGVEPSVDQEVKDISRIYSNNKLYGYGPISISLKSDQIMGEDSLKLIKEVLYEPYTGTGTPQTGYSATVLRKTPQPLYAYMPVRFANTILGRIYFDQVKAKPDLPSAKAGDSPTFTLDMTVQGECTLITPTGA